MLANGTGSQSIFAVQADKFYLFDNAGSGSSPFYVSGGITYIQNASIGNASITNAKIDNLAVDTSKIANNAVTTVNSAYSDGNLSLSTTPNNYTTIQSLSVTSTGAPIVVQVSFNCINSTGSTQIIRFQILRGATVIYDSINTQSYNGAGDPKCFMMTDQPGAGSYTYYVNVTHPSPFSYGTASVASKRSLVLMEMKK